MPLLVTGARGPWSRTPTRRVWTERYRIVSCPRLGEARAVQREAFDWALGEMETSPGLPVRARAGHDSLWRRLTGARADGALPRAPLALQRAASAQAHEAFAKREAHLEAKARTVALEQSEDPYPEGRPVKAVLKRAGGRWMATVCYEVEVPAQADDGTVTGIDRNVRQLASFDGERVCLHHGPDTARLEARTRRYQRRMARQQRGSSRRERTRRHLARTTRRIATVRHNWRHQVSRRLATGTVVLENLSTRSMTKSAKGTADAPGTNVRAKSGLNRAILATGWGAFERMLAYKAPRLVKVPARDTSRTCHACGHVDAASRRSQTTFRCVACGHADHADANAARNIRRRGLALLHGEERSAKPTPLTRETDRRLAA